MTKRFALISLITLLFTVGASADVVFPGSLANYTVKLSPGLTQIIYNSTKFQSENKITIQDERGQCDGLERVFTYGNNQTIVCHNRSNCFRFGRIVPTCSITVTDQKDLQNLCPISEVKALGTN